MSLGPSTLSQTGPMLSLWQKSGTKFMVCEKFKHPFNLINTQYKFNFLFLLILVSPYFTHGTLNQHSSFK